MGLRVSPILRALCSGDAPSQASPSGLLRVRAHPLWSFLFFLEKNGGLLGTVSDTPNLVTLYHPGIEGSISWRFASCFFFFLMLILEFHAKNRALLALGGFVSLLL